MKKEASNFKRSVDILINKNTYTLSYPNTGQLIDIELLKAKIADGNYDVLRFSTNPLFREQADKIDMIATFNVLIPSLREDLTVKSLFELSEEEADELLNVYREQFLTWFIPIKEAIKHPKKQTSQDEE